MAIEQPSYPRAMQVFRAFGAQLLPVPMVSGGLDTEALERLLERQSPKLVYCQPSAHNPTGLTMPGARAPARSWRWRRAIGFPSSRTASTARCSTPNGRRLR